VHLDHSKSEPTYDKLSLKGAWSLTRDLLNVWKISDNISKTVQDRGVVRSCDPLKILWVAIISLERLNLVVKVCTLVGYINSSNRMTYHQQKGRGYSYSHVTVLKFCHLS